MARTTRRQSYSVSTSSASYPAVQSFIQAEFKGLSDVKNDVIVDQMSFADTENVYVDDNMLLTSRPPLKRKNNRVNIVQQFVSGGREFLLTRETSGYKLTCGNSSIAWTTNIEEHVFYAQMKEHTFIWTKGAGIITYTVRGGFRREDETNVKDSYVYTPTTTLIVNGKETELESKNFLTSRYKIRHQESSLSRADREKLLGKSIDVYKDDELLYTIPQSQKNQRIFYPMNVDITNYYIDMVTAVEGDVYMRYNAGTKELGVSYDGYYYYRIPAIEGILGRPYLSRDGNAIFAFTDGPLYCCRLFATALDESAYDFTYSWTPIVSESGLNKAYIPRGEFLSETDFAFVYRYTSGSDYDELRLYARHAGKKAELRLNDEISVTDTNIAVKTCLYSNWLDVYIVGTNIKDASGRVAGLGFVWNNTGFVYEGKLSAGGGPAVNIKGAPDDWGLALDYDNTRGRLFFAIPTEKFTLENKQYSSLIIEFLVVAGRGQNGYSFVHNDDSNKFKFSQDGSLLATNRYIADITLYDSGSNETSELSNVQSIGNIPPINGATPLFIVGDEEIFYSVSNKIWTSKLNDTVLYLDETVDGGINSIMPTHYCEAGDYHFAFAQDGKYLLETSLYKTKKEGRTLFYLPIRNEQVFSEPITNLQIIAEGTFAVFTANATWNISATSLSDGTTAYTAPMKSKLPIGCREGDDTMILSDGQAILVPTPRGLAALAPKDFVATSENVINYISDNIQSLYYAFYTTKPDINGQSYATMVKMQAYRYWIFLYKYMSRELLVFDTRTSAWWKWSTPYPVISMNVDKQLQVFMYVGQSRNGANYYGISCFLQDRYNDSMSYSDDIIPNTFNGDYDMVYENKFVPERMVKKYASSIIKWHFTSQKLHFNQLNNYKAIKGMTVVLEGEDTMNAVLSTKIYRNIYHPEQNDTVQIPINELRTFTHRLNLWHAINFQYMFENNPEIDEEKPLRLGSITIKYEVKEGVR